MRLAACLVTSGGRCAVGGARASSLPGAGRAMLCAWSFSMGLMIHALGLRECPVSGTTAKRKPHGP